MSWLLDAELPLYDWSNSYHSTTPSESHMTLTPAFSFMNSSANIVAPTRMTSSILPPLANHGKMVGTSQQRKSGAADAFSPSNCVRPILTQAVARRSLEADSELSNQTCDSHGSGEGEGKEGGGRGRGGRGAKGGTAGSSSDSDRLSRRREQNRRAAVNCRRRKKERATNSLMEYQKFQCSNTELRHDLRQLTETRNRLLHQLTSLCQRCASLTSPLPTTDTHVCDD